MMMMIDELDIALFPTGCYAILLKSAEKSHSNIVKELMIFFAVEMCFQSFFEFA